MKNRAIALAVVLAVIIIASLASLLAFSRSALRDAERDNRILQSENDSQGVVIATQAFNFSRFNQVAAETGRLNSLIGATTEKTVIEYREILRREKTCDLLIPADISRRLLDHANRLRASAMHADSSDADTAVDSSSSSGGLTYCQAVLWIAPLLGLAEVGNNQFAGIREIEKTRASQ